MDEFVIYHNPQCSKSRQALALLKDAGVNPRVVLYLDTPPSPDELDVLLSKLGLEPKELMRKGEDAYAELGIASRSLSRQEGIALLAENPRLIERPIIVRGDRAVIGRPTERVQALLN